jgi:glycosyltransferase involved in cell wall biosynthesis
MADQEDSAPYRKTLLVLASTYPRWRGDYEPGFVHELNRRLVDEFDVHVVCPHSPGAERDEVMDGVSIHRFRYAPETIETLVQNGGILANLKRSHWKWCLVPFFFLGLMLACARCVKGTRPHCIHAHWIIPQGLALAVLSMFPRSLPPFVVTSHGGDLFGLGGMVFTALKRWVLKKAHAVTVVSRPMVDTVASLGGGHGYIDVIPMGVDFDGRFSLDSSVDRVPGQILFAGRLVEKKGVKYLIEALPAIRRRVPDAQLEIIGGGPELDLLVKQVYKLGLQDCVVFLGAMSQAGLPEHYRRAAVFVAPFVNAASGDREGLGLVSIEAIACGCPVVVGDVPVVSDLFLDTEMDMRAIPGSSESLAQKVVDILLAPDMAVQRVMVVRKRLEAKLSWRVVAKRYATLLHNVTKIS